MTTGLIYAAIFYFASLLLTVVGAWVWTGGDAKGTWDAAAFVARLAGPWVIAPAGWVSGFLKEKHQLEAQAREAATARAAMRRPVEGVRMNRISVVEPVASEVEDTAGLVVLSEDVRELRQAELQAAVRSLAPRPAARTAIPVKPISPEVQEYLKRTSRVDLKGIRDYVQETRAYSLGDLHRDAGLELRNDG